MTSKAVDDNTGKYGVLMSALNGVKMGINNFTNVHFYDIYRLVLHSP